ncbi:hypothetical protein MDAP_002052 [Mitosporidium daphniae]
MHIASKHRMEFNITTLTFDDTFPLELREVMKPQEFKKIVDRINSELAQDLHKNAKEIRFWFKVVGLSMIFIVGILLFPVLLQKSRRQSRLFVEFQEKVNHYLQSLNKKYLRRNIEWKIVKLDKEKSGDHQGNSYLDNRTGASQHQNSNNHRKSVTVEMINPSAPMRLEVVYESEKSRQINRRISILQTRHQGTQPGSTTSFTGMNTPTPPNSDSECHSDIIPSPNLRPLAILDGQSLCSEEEQGYESVSFPSSDSYSSKKKAKDVTPPAPLPHNQVDSNALSPPGVYKSRQSGVANKKGPTMQDLQRKNKEFYSEKNAIISEMATSKKSMRKKNLPTNPKPPPLANSQRSSIMVRSSIAMLLKDEGAALSNKKSYIEGKGPSEKTQELSFADAKQKLSFGDSNQGFSSDKHLREYKNDILREMMDVRQKNRLPTRQRNKE